MIESPSGKNNPRSSGPLEQFATALSNLLHAARGHYCQTENGIDQLESLHAEAQLAAPAGITLSTFRRAVWPADRCEPILASTDGGETYKMVPSYVFVQHGNQQAVAEYISQLTALAEAVQRRLSAVEPPEEVEPSAAEVSAPPQPAFRLNPTDKNILKVVRRKAIKGMLIARKIDSDYDYVRRRLGKLVAAGYLEKTENGYRAIRTP